MLLYICCQFVTIDLIWLVECVSSSHLVMDGHMSRIFSVQYTPGQDDEFLSGGWDDTVQVIKIFTDWLYRSGNLKVFSPAIAVPLMESCMDLPGTVKTPIITTLIFCTTSIDCEIPCEKHWQMVSSIIYCNYHLVKLVFSFAFKLLNDHTNILICSQYSHLW